MHMSLACPRIDPRDIQGNMLENTREWIKFSAPWEGKFTTLFQVRGKRVGNCKFCKIVDGNHGDITGIYRFPQTIIMGNMK